MIINNRIRIIRAMALTAMVAVSFGASALPNLKFKSNGERTTGNGNGQFRTTAGTCKPAQSAIDLDINNVRARLMTGGDMWWDIGTAEARYEVPKGTKKNSLFAGSIWVGGYDPQGQLKVAAQTYRQDGNDYWPGPLDPTSSSQVPSTSATICSEWDRFWKVNKADIIAFRDLIAKGGDVTDVKYEAIRQWPAKGNTEAVGNSGNPLAELQSGREYAPYIDANGDHIYNYNDGDYPDIFGDQFIWWVFNDAGNVKQQSQTDAIGMEVQASAFAFATKDNLNNATFYNYRLINRGNLRLDSTYMGTWTDADLGYAFDDYIGCDTTRGLGILYNGKSIDGQGEINSYGSQIPMVGVDFFIGPSKDVKINGLDTTIRLRMTNFTYYNNDFTVIGNPSNGPQIYGYMTGTIRGGQRFTYDWNGVAGNTSKGYGTGPTVNYVFYGDPGVSGQWSECACNNKPDDRRFIHSAGPFTLKPGGVQNDVTIGAVWVADAGGCPNTSFTKIRIADDQAQDLFDNGFKTIEGPEAPRLVIREMDRKLIFYIVNDSSSTNFQERFGNDASDQKYRVSTPDSRKYSTKGDSLYVFEGYRVFQVKSAEIQPAQIFGANGEVDKTVAIEIFQTDVKNGTSRIINWDKQTEIPGQPYIPQTKVTGKDSGIVHSFTLQFDAFAKGADKRLVNYRNYHFIAIAYAYNNFRQFDPANLNGADSMQKIPYLESAHGGGGIPIPVYHPMPNPTLDNMGTYSSADYGTGVIIKRLEGIGNGGGVLQLSDASETEALNPPYISLTPEYKIGQGPVNVKVVDPVKVQGGSWELYINGALNTDTARGINPDSGTWRLVRNGTETIYSERNISAFNEQILEKYGISVGVVQVLRPGEDQANGNGYITSSAVFADPSKAWLAGVNDDEGRSPLNWIRSGGVDDTFKMCNYSDYKADTVGSYYEGLFSGNSLLKGTWAPYTLASEEYNQYGPCDFGVARKQTTAGSSATFKKGMYNLHSVDVVFTSDKSKWTKCVVFEMHDVTGGINNAEGGAEKFAMRKHASWTGDVDGNGNPVYDNTTTGFSWFPGYAIDQETGERLNMAFGEDSWLASENGRDMIWNPTSSILSNTGNVLFGGKHYVYVMGTRYDEDKALSNILIQNSTITVPLYFQNTMMWVGVPRLNNGFNLLPLKDGLIPTETRLKMRVTRPYNKYIADASLQLKNGGLPLYSFNTDNLVPHPLTDAANPYANDKQALLDKIQAVPNPYYGYDGYEKNRLDTRVRIINLPRKATISVYSLDGTLIRRIASDNTGALASSTNDDDKYRGYIDWDVRNAKGLPIASGMYLIHVQAEGIGETVIRWFGSMRPIDVTTY